MFPLIRQAYINNWFLLCLLKEKKQKIKIMDPDLISSLQRRTKTFISLSLNLFPYFCFLFWEGWSETSKKESTQNLIVFLHSNTILHSIRFPHNFRLYYFFQNVTSVKTVFLDHNSKLYQKPIIGCTNFYFFGGDWILLISEIFSSVFFSKRF